MMSQLNFPSYEQIEAFVFSEMEKLFRKIPFTKEFHEGKLTHPEYYKRHIIETVIRIRLNNELDAYCLYKISRDEKDIANQLVKYLAEEYSHDDLFIADLKELGVTEKEVNETQPLFATQLLIGYLYYSINLDGVTPVLTWNWLVEWYSSKYNLVITKKAEKELGVTKTKGVLTHLQIDQCDNHPQFMFSALELLMKKDKEEDKVRQYLSNFIQLIGMYFQELYEATISQ